MREDGFYWTAYHDGDNLEIREWYSGYWYTCGEEIRDGADVFAVISAKLLPPSETEYLLSSPANAPEFCYAVSEPLPPEAKPKSGMTDAERELLLALGRVWVGDNPVVYDAAIRHWLNAVEAEGK